MIQANERSGLGHSVSLNHGVSQAVPKRFVLLRQSGSAGNKGPKFPAKMPVNAPESPPTEKKVLLFRLREIPAKCLQPSVSLLTTFHFPLKGFDDSRNRDQYGDALLPDGIHQIGWLQRIGEASRSGGYHPARARLRIGRGSANHRIPSAGSGTL